MIRIALAVGAMVVAVLAVGCPPHPAVENKPRTPYAPADYRLLDCALEPAPPAGTATRKECYHENDYRPSASLHTCPEGELLENGLCYRRCPTGYTGDGPVCWKNCPAGYRDDGVTCRKDLSIVRADRHGCPWYDVCGIALGRGCTSCPEGYRNDGCTCVRDVRIIGQDAEGRGAGSIPGCSANEEKFGFRCYGACPQGSTPNGFMCVANGETCVDVPVQPKQPLFTFCVHLTGENFCTVKEIAADTAENAAAMAACQACMNCSTQVIDCSFTDTVCR